MHRPFEFNQYTAIRLTGYLVLEVIASSIETVGDAYDHALMVTVNVLFNAGWIRIAVFRAGPYRSLADVEYATAG